MHSIINTFLSEQLLSFWVLLLIVVVERYLPWPDKYHPLSFIRVLAKGMQAKVLSPERNTNRQQKV
jgi:adenosylcobinamide-phosphate synthase